MKLHAGAARITKIVSTSSARELTRIWLPRWTGQSPSHCSFLSWSLSHRTCLFMALWLGLESAGDKKPTTSPAVGSCLNSLTNRQATASPSQSYDDEQQPNLSNNSKHEGGTFKCTAQRWSSPHFLPCTRPAKPQIARRPRRCTLPWPLSFPPRHFPPPQRRFTSWKGPSALGSDGGAQSGSGQAKPGPIFSKLLLLCYPSSSLRRLPLIETPERGSPALSPTYTPAWPCGYPPLHDTPPDRHLPCPPVWIA